MHIIQAIHMNYQNYNMSNSYELPKLRHGTGTKAITQQNVLYKTKGVNFKKNYVRLLFKSKPV